MEHVTDPDPDPELAQVVPEADMAARSKVRGAPPSVTCTVADRPVTEALEVLATVAPQPPSVPPDTWFWRGGVEAGPW
jgi:hypothetical protein